MIDIIRIWHSINFKPNFINTFVVKCYYYNIPYSGLWMMLTFIVISANF